MKIFRHFAVWLSGKDESFGAVPFQRKNGKLSFLLIQQHQGHWDFPKGHAEGKEKPLETAEREVREETGLKEFTLLPSPTFLVEYSFWKEQRRVHKRVTFFIAEVKGDSLALQAEEIRDAAWLPYDEAMTKITFPAGRKLLKQVNEFLKAH